MPVDETAASGVAHSDAQKAGRPSRARVLLRGATVRAFGLSTFYVVMLVFFSLTSEQFLSFSNALNIVANVTLIGIVSIGQALAIISGGFDLSVGGIVPLSAVTYAILVNHGVPIPIAMVAALLTGTGIGLLNGVIITKLGINSLITTLGTLSVGVGLAFTVTKGLTLPFTNLDAAVLTNQAPGGIPYYVIAFALLTVASWILLRNTGFGRNLYAIGGNREASRLAGIRVNLMTVATYVLSGSLAGFAGVVIASELFAGSPSVGSDAALTSIAAVILGGAALTGGVGGIPGTMVGVLVLGTLNDGMALLTVPTYYQEIATGLLLLLAVGVGRLRSSVRL